MRTGAAAAYPMLNPILDEGAPEELSAEGMKARAEEGGADPAPGCADAPAESMVFRVWTCSLIWHASTVSGRAT